MLNNTGRPHIALKPRTIRGPRRGWGGGKDEGEEEVYFFSDYGELSTNLSEVKESASEKEKNSPIKDLNYYFEISIRGKIFWQHINNIFRKLKINIKTILSDHSAIFSLKKLNYEEFHLLLANYLDVIENIREVSVYRRVNETLFNEIKENPLDTNIYTVEFSSLTGFDSPKTLAEEFSTWIEENDGTHSLNFLSDDLILYSVELKNGKMNTIIETLEAVTRIDKKPQLSLYSGELNFQLDFIKDRLIEASQSEELPTICIIDSGIHQNHNKLRDFIEATYDFYTQNPQPCADVLGHGTWVSGLAIYGQDPMNSREPSAKIIMVKNFLDEKTAIIDDINAIQNILDMFPDQFKILNLSYSSNGPNSSLTKVIDKIVYDHKLVLVTSTGNISLEEIINNLRTGEEYPEYLRKYPIYYPGDCRNVITVGGCTNKETSFVPNKSPSPFTRSCPYTNFTKPDLVEFSGTLDATFESNVVELIRTGYGISTTSHNGHGFVERQGTSFSAPLVSNIVARLYSQLRIQSPELLKALILNSCEKLSNEHGFLYDVDIQGFGKPHFDFALNSNIHRVNYLLEGRFSSRYPHLCDRYEIWFPVGANEIETTMVCSKSSTVYEGEEKDNISFNVTRRAGTGGRTYFNTIEGNRYCCNTYKGNFSVERGSRGPWTIDLIPNFSGGRLFPLEMRYGCVITVKDTTKSNDIWKTTFESWVEERLESPVPSIEELESQVVPLQPIIIESDL